MKNNSTVYFPAPNTIYKISVSTEGGLFIALARCLFCGRNKKSGGKSFDDAVRSVMNIIEIGGDL